MCQGPVLGTRLDVMSEQPAPSPAPASPAGAPSIGAPFSGAGDSLLPGGPLPAHVASALKRDGAGLVAAIVQQFDTNEVLMLGWMDDEALNRKYGMLGVLDHLFTNAADPSLHEHAAALRDEWLPARELMLADEDPKNRDAAGEALLRSREFSRLIDGEISGEL